MGPTTILFRADGNGMTGLGHLYRLIALAEIYKQYFNFLFITKTSSTTTIFPEDYKTFFIPSNVTIQEEPSWLSKQFDAQNHIIIADGYQFKSLYQKQLKDHGFKLMYIDDLIEGKMYADIVINHTPNISLSQYQLSKNTRLALGTDYAILRPSFTKAAQTFKEIADINDAFVCFGGADILDLSLKVTHAFLQIETITTIHVVLGAAYEHTQIENLANDHQHLKIYRNLDESTLYDVMHLCQIAIVPSSTIVYELCSVKMVVLSGYFVDNQKNIYNALLEKGAIYGLGNIASFSAHDFMGKIVEVIDENNLSPYLKAQQSLFNGKNSDRLIQLLNCLVVSFKTADVTDMMMVYNWSNDPLTRQNSFHSEPITLEQHKKWFHEKIENAQTLFLISIYNGQPAGIVRYDLKTDHAVVGVVVDEKFRGKKLSSTFLSESAKLYFEQNPLPIFAYIKENNKASIKAFKNAGYFFYKKELIEGSPSFVYKLEIDDLKR